MIISPSDVMDCLSKYELSENEKKYLGDHIYRYVETFNLISSIIEKVEFIKKVLDLGSGYGHMAAILKFFYNHQVYAIDFQEKLESLFSQRGIPFKGVDLEKEKIPFGDNFFDLILFCEVIEHLNPNCFQVVLGEVHRILSADGYLILTTPVRGLFSRMFNMFVRPQHSRKKILERALHVKTYERKRLQRMLQNVGFITVAAAHSKAWESSGLSIRGLPKQLRSVRKFLGNFPLLVESDLMMLCIKK